MPLTLQEAREKKRKILNSKEDFLQLLLERIDYYIVERLSDLYCYPDEPGKIIKKENEYHEVKNCILISNFELLKDKYNEHNLNFKDRYLPYHEYIIKTYKDKGWEVESVKFNAGRYLVLYESGKKQKNELEENYSRFDLMDV